MKYATCNDLIKRFGEDELLGVAESETHGTLDKFRVETALSDASRHIDSYLRLRRSVPVDPVPDVLVGACADIARFKLHDDHAPEEVAKRYKATIAWLKDVAAGRASLGEDDTAITGSGRVVRRRGKSGLGWNEYVV